MAVTLDRSVFSKLSGSSKILGVSLVIGYIVVLISSNGEKSFALNNLALVAGKTFPFGCWNVVTSAFVEDSLPSVRPYNCIHWYRTYLLTSVVFYS